MTLLNTIKRELNALDIKPKKSLGQNFLINEGVYKKIVAALEIKKNDTIVEVGPGLGTLTGYLVESGAEIIAIEKDRKLAEYLKQKFQNNPNIEIIEEDILKFNPRPCTLYPKPYKIVGNIPYYLTSRLLRTVFEKWPRPELIVFMVQKEVAKRIVASPPEMSLLAVSVQYFAKAEFAGLVSRVDFYPQPKVDSAIIKLRPKLETGNSKTQAKFFKVAKAGFASKRKQLANNLSRVLKLNKQRVEYELLSLGVLPQRRAETLTIEEWQKITDTFS